MMIMGFMDKLLLNEFALFRWWSSTPGCSEGVDWTKDCPKCLHQRETHWWLWWWAIWILCFSWLPMFPQTKILTMMQIYNFFFYIDPIHWFHWSYLTYYCILCRYHGTEHSGEAGASTDWSWSDCWWFLEDNCHCLGLTPEMSLWCLYWVCVWINLMLLGMSWTLLLMLYWSECRVPL